RRCLPRSGTLPESRSAAIVAQGSARRMAVPLPSVFASPIAVAVWPESGTLPKSRSGSAAHQEGRALRRVRMGQRVGGVAQCVDTIAVETDNKGRSRAYEIELEPCVNPPVRRGLPNRPPDRAALRRRARTCATRGRR